MMMLGDEEGRSCQSSLIGSSSARSSSFVSFMSSTAGGNPDSSLPPAWSSSGLGVEFLELLILFSTDNEGGSCCAIMLF